MLSPPNLLPWQAPMETLRILIVDDHQTVRMLLRNILESIPEWEICGEATNGEAAVTCASTLLPDVVVMDLVMPLCNGLEATRRLRIAAPEIRVILTTLHDFPSFAAEARKVGACGCFFKSLSGRHLIPAVRAAVDHRPFFTWLDLEAPPPS
jgi:DNA-binding NarL/FixJ family response regulator